MTSSALVFIVDFLRDIYKETRFKPQRKDWLPSHLKVPVRFTLIQHVGQHTCSNLHNIRCCHRRGSFVVDKLAMCDSARSIKDIFVSFSKSILIEGVPGIGKSVLSNEVAYFWATGEILVGMNLFHLDASDNDLHSVSSTSDLFRYLNTKHDIFGHDEVEIATSELKNSKGSNIVFVIDGYNECPVDCQLRLFVDKLLSVERLPKCRIVIITRPSATVSLYHLVEQRYEIIGLTSTEQNIYISEVFKETPERKIELKKYLTLYPIIKILTYSPFYLSVLLHLVKQDNLPKTLTEITELLIVYTVRRELTNQGQLFSGINKLSNLPKSVLVCVHHLAQLAFEGIESQRYDDCSFSYADNWITWFPVFTLSEDKKMCPQNDSFSGASDGFGLLHVLEQYSPERETRFSFIHDAMQSFLAALHISMIGDEEQLLLIKEKFEKKSFDVFIWTMYAGITKQGSKHLNLSRIGAATFSELVHLRLFQCYWEANKSVYPLSSTDEKVEVNYSSLSSHDFMSLIFFLIKYPMQWKSIEIKCSMIHDSEFKMLQQCFTKYKNKFISLEHICLFTNKISLEGTCAHELLSKIHSLQSLDLGCNKIGDTGATKLANAMLKLMDESKDRGEYSALNTMTTHSVILDARNKIFDALRELDISWNNISDTGAIAISNCLRVNYPLLKLNLKRNEISCKGLQNIAESLQVNIHLQYLNISNNNISDQTVIAFGECLIKNNTLLKLKMSASKINNNNNWTGNTCIKIAEAICVNKTIQELDISFNEIPKNEVLKLSNSLKCNNTLGKLKISWESCRNVAFDRSAKSCIFHRRIGEIGAHVLSDFLCCNTTVQKLTMSFIGMNAHGATAISECLMENKALVEINMSSNRISSEGATQIANALLVNHTVRILDISDNDIADEGAIAMGECIASNNALEEFNVARNNITAKGAKAISKALQINATLRRLIISNNNLSYDGAVAIGECLSALVELNISSCNTTCEGATIILKAMHANKTLRILNISNNRLSNPTVVFYIGDFLTVNTTLVHLDISANNITYEGTKVIAKGLMVNRTLKELNLSSANIKNEGVKAIEEVAQLNTTVLRLKISDNKITDGGLAAISNYLKIHPTLVELDMSENNITDEGAKVFAEIIQMNKTLQSLSISFDSNNGKYTSYTIDICVYTSIEPLVLSEGEIRIVEAVLVNTSLYSLNIFFCSSGNRLGFNLALIDAMFHNNTLTRLILPLDGSDCCRMERNATPDINKRRKEFGLNCLHIIGACNEDFTDCMSYSQLPYMI